MSTQTPAIEIPHTIRLTRFVDGDSVLNLFPNDSVYCCNLDLADISNSSNESCFGLSVSFFMALSVFSFDVFVFKGVPLFDKKSMWIIIRSGYVSQVSFGNKTSCDNRSSAD